MCWQAEGYELEFPDLFKEKITDEETTAQDYKKAAEESKNLSMKQWTVQDIPPWFRWRDVTLIAFYDCWCTADMIHRRYQQ